MKPHAKIRRAAKWTGTAISAVLIAIWIASNWYYVIYSGETTHYVVNCGRFQYSWNRPFQGGGPYIWRRWRHGFSGNPRWFFWWFGYTDGSTNTPPTPSEVRLPIWSLAVLTLIPTGTLWTLDELAKRRRRNRGKCSHCLFDLAGLPFDAKCPECGKNSLPKASVKS